MRLPRVRLTVRGMMVAVALVATWLAGDASARHRAAGRRHAVIAAQ